VALIDGQLTDTAQKGPDSRIAMDAWQVTEADIISDTSKQAAHKQPPVNSSFEASIFPIGISVYAPSRSSGNSAKPFVPSIYSVSGLPYTPVTPQSADADTLAGHPARASFAESRDIELVSEIWQSFIIDSGAFSFWNSGEERSCTIADWDDYTHSWRSGHFTWAATSSSSPTLSAAAKGKPRADRRIRGHPPVPAGHGVPVFTCANQDVHFRRLSSEGLRLPSADPARTAR
jgi:hypothetical protein